MDSKDRIPVTNEEIRAQMRNVPDNVRIDDIFDEAIILAMKAKKKEIRENKINQLLN